MAAITNDDTSALISYLLDPSKLDRNDWKSRERLIQICQDVSFSLETPIESARRHAFLSLDHAVIRSAIQLNVFTVLATEKQHVCSTESLAIQTTPPCDPALLSRLLRYLSSPLRLVNEEGPNLWKSTARGSLLADSDLRLPCEFYFDSAGAAFQALPSWVIQLCDSGFGALENNSSVAKSAFGLALPNEAGFFSWLKKDERKLEKFNDWMSTIAKHQYTSQQSLDLSEWIPDSTDGNPHRVDFVDIGGGQGATCITLRDKRTRASMEPAKLVLQDLVEVINTIDIPGVEIMPHDFFAEQPIKGASVYHFRQIFHDWPDEDCVKILQRMYDAMIDSKSTILIDEVVIPDSGSHWMVTQRDLTMLALFNATERSEAQWRDLLQQANLALVDIRCYDERMAACLIVAKKKE